MAQTVIGFFDNPTDAQKAISKLQESGISRNSIDVSTGNSASGDTPSGSLNEENSDTAHESGITRFFKSLFGDDEEDAARYSHVGHSSQAIVTVHAQSAEEAQSAADVLDENGAIDVDERANEYGYTGGTGNRANAATSGREGVVASGNDTEKSTSIPRIEEELQVGKRTVETGGVRVRSRIVEKPVEENVRLREEYVRVERTPVNRAVTDTDFANFKESEIELTERAEVPVVNKEARVVEEIHINKEVNERNETIRDTVRHTDVDVEQLGGTKGSDIRDAGSADRTTYNNESDRTNSGI